MSRQENRPFRRRGNVVVITAASLTMLCCFAALTIDTGYGYNVKAELQRTADACALAGAAAYTSDDNLLEYFDPTADALTLADFYAAENQNTNIGSMTLCEGDVVLGYLDPDNPGGDLDPSVANYNAVQVTVRRDSSCNGEIPTFFGKILGFDSIPVSTSATAMFEDRFAGYQAPDSGTGPMTPFTISQQYYEEQLAANIDDWTWNEVTQSPQAQADSVNEVWIYPEDNNDNGNGNGNESQEEGAGGGSFGTLNIGIGNQGTSQLGTQIQNGLSASDLIAEIGTDSVVFVDDNGNALSYTISGNPGLSAGLSAYVEARIGEVIGFFIHDGNLTGNGSNAQFNIIDIKFGRLMEIDLTGNPQDKRIVIQPVVYSGPGPVFDSAASSSNGTIVTLRLVQ